MGELPQVLRFDSNDDDLSLFEAAEKKLSATDQYGASLYQFDKDVERRIRMKADLCTVPLVSLIYLFCFIDRSNIGNARLAGFEESLNIKGYDFNVILTSFYISYIIFEIPATFLCKYIGPGWFIPASALGFGCVSIATGATHTMAQVCGVRFVLGIFEAGLLPGIALYLSRWYRRSELVFRLSLYIVAAPLAGAFGGLIASGILKTGEFGEFEGWRKIFAVEGIITIGLSIIGFFVLADRPETARWLTVEEKTVAVMRIKSERIGAREVLDEFSKTKVLRGIFNPVTLATSWIFLLNNVTIQGLAFFLPTIVRALYTSSDGYTIVQEQLHTIPPYLVGAFFTILFPLLSWLTDKRLLFFIISIPIAIIGYIMYLADSEPHVRYAATFLIAGGSFAFGALCNAQVSANVVSDTARTAAIGTDVMLGNIGGLISTWSYMPDSAPNFTVGTSVNLATSSAILITSLVLYLWMKLDNAKRDKVDVDEKLTGLTDQQVEDLDWRHPGFRWRP